LRYWGSVGEGGDIDQELLRPARRIQACRPYDRRRAAARPLAKRGTRGGFSILRVELGAMSSGAFHPAVARLEHIALATNDAERLCGFYQLLGAMAAPVAPDLGTGVRSRVLDFCGVGLELSEQPCRGQGVAGGVLAPGFVHLGFALGSADAVDELTRVIAAAGHRVIEWPHRTGELGRYESVVLDPDGNRVRLTV
jgi:lactoylglutathione lyase